MFYAPLAILATIVFFARRDTIPDHWILVTLAAAVGGLILFLVARMLEETALMSHAVVNAQLFRATHPEVKKVNRF